MNTLTLAQFEEYIENNPWEYVDTKYSGTEAYESHIGIMRMLFGIDEDPISITTLLSPTETQLWTMSKDRIWARVY